MQVLIKSMLTTFVLLYLIPQKANAQAERVHFVNKIKKINASGTIRWDYIECGEDYTFIYFTYLGKKNIGSFTEFYLKNLRILDKDNYDIYTTYETDHIPKSVNSKFYIYNEGKDVKFLIKFYPLSQTARRISLVDGASESDPFEFTFINQEIHPERDESNDKTVKSDMFNWGHYLQAFCTTEDLNIDISVDNAFVGAITEHFNNKVDRLYCGDKGTFTVCFATDEKHSFKGVAKYGSGEYKWNFDIEGSTDCYPHWLTR